MLLDRMCPPKRGNSRGTVHFDGCDPVHGGYVRIDHGDGFSSTYYHILDNTITVHEGDVVQRGYALGLQGKNCEGGTGVAPLWWTHSV